MRSAVPGVIRGTRVSGSTVAEGRAFVVAEGAVRPDRYREITGLPLSTYFAGPIVVVNGPIARAIGMNSGGNAMGQGNRANASIGLLASTNSTARWPSSC